MEYEKLVQDAARRPGCYGLDGTYGQLVAFVRGCDAGNEWGLLIGFPEWLAQRVHCEANLDWSRLVLLAAGAQHGIDDPDTQCTATLVESLGQFLDCRKGPHGARTIIESYLRRSRPARRQQQEEG